MDFDTPLLVLPGVGSHSTPTRFRLEGDRKYKFDPSQIWVRWGRKMAIFQGFRGYFPRFFSRSRLRRSRGSCVFLSWGRAQKDAFLCAWFWLSFVFVCIQRRNCEFFFRSRPRRSALVYLWAGCAPKKSPFCVRDFGGVSFLRQFEPAEAKFRVFFQQFGDENPNFSPARAALVNFWAGGAPKQSPFYVRNFGGVSFFAAVLSSQKPNFGWFPSNLVMKTLIFLPLAPSALTWLWYAFEL